MTNGGTPPQQPPPGGPPPGGQYPPQQPPPGGYPPPGPPQYASVPVAPWGAPLASWGKRVGAALIDGVVVSIPSFIIMAVLGIGTFASSDLECTTDINGFTNCEGDGSFVVKILLIYLVVFALQIAYQVYFNGGEKGQTVGKMALKIQVRDEQTGGPVGYGKAFLRVLVGAGLALACGIGSLVDLLFPLWDPKRQTLHDKAANTLVVEAPQ